MSDPITGGMALMQAVLNAGAAIANTADAAKRQAQLVEFQKAITQSFMTIAELQLANAGLAADKAELEKECVRLKDWSAEKANYTMRKIGPGVFAQVENKPVNDLQDAHKLCCNCFDKTIKATLQQTVEHKSPGGRMIGLTCPNKCPQLVFSHYESP